MHTLKTATSVVAVTVALVATPAGAAAPCGSSQTVQCTPGSALAAIECVPPAPLVRLRVLGGERAGLFNTLASEIAAFERHSRRLFVVNVAQNVVDPNVRNGKPSLRVIDMSRPAQPVQVANIDLASRSGFAKVVPTSVTAALRVVAVSVVDGNSGAGKVLFFDAYGLKLSEIAVGATPDMVAFSPDGRTVLVANGGVAAGSVDLEGSISVIGVGANGSTVTERRATFAAFNGAAARAKLSADGVRLLSEKTNASVAEMLQPEYIAISANSRTAWVTLQHNNAIAVVDIVTAKVTNVHGLGLKDHRAPGKGFDGGDRDGPTGGPRQNIRNWKILGLYQPDAIGVFRSNDRDYLVTANEGNAREFEEARAAELVASGANLPEYPGDVLTSGAKLARLKVSKIDGFNPVTKTYGTLRAFGGRSFSIWTAAADQVFDSGDAFECITAKVGRMAGTAVGPLFNPPDDEKSPDLRSDDRGPEPEGVALGSHLGRTYAFIGLERQGGLMVYDVSKPAAPAFQQYINPRDATADPRAVCTRGVPESVACAALGDLGPEGVLFIPASASPTLRPLVVTANETSGSTRIYELIAGDE